MTIYLLDFSNVQKGEYRVADQVSIAKVAKALQFLDYVGKAVFTTIIELDKFQRPETSKIEKVRIWTLNTITNISNKFAICICHLKIT